MGLSEQIKCIICYLLIYVLIMRFSMKTMKHIFVGVGIVAAIAITIFVYIGVQLASIMSLYVIGAVILLILTGIAVHYLGDISSSDES